MHPLTSAFILGYHGCYEAVGERLLAGVPLAMKSRAAIRVFSPDLAPSEISERLNRTASFSRRAVATINLATGEWRTSSRWRFDVKLDDVVPLGQKITWALGWISPVSAQLIELKPFASRIDLYSSLHAEFLGDSEALTESTIHALGRSPIDFELAFYHPSSLETVSGGHQTWESAALIVSGLQSIEVLSDRCQHLGFECSGIGRNEASVNSTQTDATTLAEHINALLSFIERCPESLAGSAAREIRCMFESSGGGLGGVSLPVALLKRMADASVGLQFQLGLRRPTS